MQLYHGAIRCIVSEPSICINTHDKQLFNYYFPIAQQNIWITTIASIL